MTKRIFLVFLMLFIFVSVFIPKDISAACSCELINEKPELIPGKKTCSNKNRTEVMYVDPKADDGCTCKCEIIGSSPKKTEIYCGDLKSINTALGCVPIETGEFMGWLLPIIFSIGGGIAFLLMTYGFILVAVSSGDEKKLQGAKETISSAIIGLIVCISALFILKMIAIDILKIPGF